MTENTQALALRAVAFSLLKDRIAAGEGLTKQDLAELIEARKRELTTAHGSLTRRRGSPHNRFVPSGP